MVIPAKYIIYKGTDGKTYANNGTTEFSGTDSASVIHDAINDSGRIFMRDATYIMNSSLLYQKDGLVIEGESHNTILKLGDNINADVLSTGRRNNARTILKNFRIDGNKANNTSGRGLVFTGYYSVIDNIFIENCPGNGFESEVPIDSGASMVDNFVSNIRTRTCGGTGFKWGSMTGGQGSDNYFQNLLSWYNEGDGIDIDYSDQNLYLCHSYSNKGHGVIVRCSDSRIFDGISENNNKNGFWICRTGAWNTVLTACISWNNSKSDAGKYHGFYIDGADSYTSGRCSIIGSIAYDDQNPKTQGWGVTSNYQTAVSRNMVIGGSFTNNLSGAININGNILRAANINDPLYDNKGIFTASGTGKKVQFGIPHGLVGIPTNVQLEARTSGASGSKYWSANNTNIIVNFITAPPNGTNNIVISWKAEV